MNCLVRYGAIPEVARCRTAREMPLDRGRAVVVETHRGLQLGSVVEVLRESSMARQDAVPSTGEAQEEEAGFTVLRLATTEDATRQQTLRSEADAEFAAWNERIRQWKIEVQLVDLEWTLDRGKLILYVLNERGPECTKLAIQAAAAGLGIVEVQPVSSEGLVSQPTSGGGCGTCGCHN